jgi:hypothetical protein
MPSNISGFLTTRLHFSEIEEIQVDARKTGVTKSAWIAHAAREKLTAVRDKEN